MKIDKTTDCTIDNNAMEIKIYHNSIETPLQEMALLLNKAFLERQQEGIDFVYATYSSNDLEMHVKDGYYIVAYEASKVVGMLVLIQKKRYGINYLTHECLAVDPNMKNKGIASKMFNRYIEIAKDLNAGFIISTTAENAYSSIRYHRKNGFKTFLFVSFPTTQYYSYCFIYPIRRLRLLKYNVFNKPIFLISYLYTKLFKKERYG